jgi:hypothetical protein
MVMAIKFTQPIRRVGKPECTGFKNGNGILKVEDTVLLTILIAVLAYAENIIATAFPLDVITLRPSTFLYA